MREDSYTAVYVIHHTILLFVAVPYVLIRARGHNVKLLLSYTTTVVDTLVPRPHVGQIRTIQPFHDRSTYIL